MFVMFYICYKSKKEHTTWNDNSGMRVLHNFQCTFYAAIYCICVLYLILIYGHDDSLKPIKWNAANSQYAFNHYTSWYYSYISYLISNVLLFNSVISLDYGLPNDLGKMMFVDCKWLKPNYISHIMKCISFSAHKALPCNSQFHYVTLK